MTESNLILNVRHSTHADGSTHLRHLGGWKKQPADSRDYRVHLPALHAASLPAHVDNRSLASPIRDQKQLGACTAFAAGAAVESREEAAGRKALAGDRAAFEASAKVSVSNVQLDAAGVVSFTTRVTPPPAPPPPPPPQPPTPGKLTVVSTLFQYYESRVDEGTVSEDSGATIRGAIQAMVKHGCVDESIYPYKPESFAVAPPPAVVAAASAHKVTSYHSIADGDLNGLKAMIAAGYFVVFGFEVYSYFMSQEMATKAFLNVPAVGETYEGGHAVCLVGYDDATKAFLVRNSWGTGWGLSGYFWMSYDYFAKQSGGSYFASDFWVVEAAPVGL